LNSERNREKTEELIQKQSLLGSNLKEALDSEINLQVALEVSVKVVIRSNSPNLLKEK
jgi:hypothetical protein